MSDDGSNPLALFWDAPAAIVPPGQPTDVDLDNPPSIAAPLVIGPAVFVGIMWIFVAGRIASKKKLVGRFGWDDASCVLSAVLTSVFYGLTTASVSVSRIGTHLWYVRVGDFASTRSIQIEFLTVIFSPITLFFIKLTFFLLYLNLFRPIYTIRLGCYIGIIISVMGYLGFLIAFIILGTPQHGESWQQHLLSDQYASSIKLSVPLPAFDLGLDAYILVLPLIGVFNLKLNMKRRIGVALVFFTAIIAMVAAILCVVYRVQFINDPLQDITYDLDPIYLTADFEMILGVIIACMPSFAGLVRTMLPSFDAIRGRFDRLHSRSASRTEGGSSRRSTISEKTADQRQDMAHADSNYDCETGVGVLGKFHVAHLVDSRLQSRTSMESPVSSTISQKEQGRNDDDEARTIFSSISASTDGAGFFTPQVQQELEQIPMPPPAMIHRLCSEENEREFRRQRRLSLQRQREWERNASELADSDSTRRFRDTPARDDTEEDAGMRTDVSLLV